MKRFTKLFSIVAVASLTFVGHASAQIGASATGEANARIITGLSISKTADLEFSEIISNGVGGTVTISTDGDVAYDGVNAYPGSKTPGAATFQVRGESDKHFYAELPKEIEIRNENDEEMVVNGFTIDSEEDYTLDKKGQDVLTIGATLNVKANQDAGFYKGEFRVMVNYN